MSDLDVVEQPTVVGSPKRCRRHDWTRRPDYQDGELMAWIRCSRCGKPKDEALSRRGKQSRNYGNRAELEAARRYGGEKIGHAQGPVDIRGVDFDTQMKTHRRKPPAEWTTAINAMSAGNRIPRLLVRFVQAGHAPDDWFVFRAKDFLDWFGRDEQ